MVGSVDSQSWPNRKSTMKVEETCNSSGSIVSTSIFTGDIVIKLSILKSDHHQGEEHRSPRLPHSACSSDVMTCGFVDSSGSSARPPGCIVATCTRWLAFDNGRIDYCNSLCAQVVRRLVVAVDSVTQSNPSLLSWCMTAGGVVYQTRQ